jgi:hypothetical protein
MHSRVATGRLAALALVVLMAWNSAESNPVVRVQTGKNDTVTFMSWDTEGGGRAGTNLLRSPAGARKGHWSVTARESDIDIVVTPGANGAEIVLPFDPRITPTTVLPTEWLDDGSFSLPAIVNAPDFGPMLLKQSGGAPMSGRLEGSRSEKYVNIILDAAPATQPIKLALTPLLLDPPAGLHDAARWSAARRGWLNGIQPCSKWGEQGKPFSAPPGILGNNVISDPASSSLWFYADQAFFVPSPGGISLMPMLRRTIEYWIDQKMKRDAQGRETGELICYWDYADFLDANAGPLIASWDYVQVTHDTAWLEKKIARLEMVADFLIRRDIDDDGMIEATQSGNYNSLQQPGRSCAWWDALNCGHKDGYTNALIYRAFSCLADLEGQLKRGAQQAKYSQRADKLKAAYFKTLYNEKTGWLAWWKSADGTLHDYASPTLNGLAIEYGLVPADKAKQILDKLWKKMDAAGFTRFDLGVPPMLVPVVHGDYLQPEAIGMPHRADGTDTFGIYMNGGITAGQVLHFLAANDVVGETARADKVLDAMLARQQRGGFENGVTDAAMQGIDWTTWDGKPSGYEGYLADSFRFLQAVLLREPAFREKLYRPMLR